MKKFFLLSAVAATALTMSAQTDLYLIGSNVNDKSWTLLAEDAKMTMTSEGIYEWDGEVLGSGFKINDGTWSNDELNIGAGAEPFISVGEPYYYSANGNSGNIAYDGFTQVLKPHIVLDMNAGTILLTGEKSGQTQWYITGINDAWNLDANEVMAPVEGQEGIYEKKGLEITAEGTFKVSNDGWGEQYGDNTGELIFGMQIFSSVLEKVGGEGGSVPYFMMGTFDVKWDLAKHFIEFNESTGVNEIEAVDGAARYYNLQGAPVAEPENGIFVKVLNGKATKVAIR